MFGTIDFISRFFFFFLLPSYLFSLCKFYFILKVDPSCTLINPLRGIQSAAGARGVEVEYAMGCDIATSRTSGFSEALAAARRADVVVAVMGIITCQEQGYVEMWREGAERVEVVGWWRADSFSHADFIIRVSWLLFSFDFVALFFSCSSFILDDDSAISASRQRLTIGPR